MLFQKHFSIRGVFYSGKGFFIRERVRDTITKKVFHRRTFIVMKKFLHKGSVLFRKGVFSKRGGEGYDYVNIVHWI